MAPSNEVNVNTIELHTVTSQEGDGEVEYDEDYLMGKNFTETFKIHFENLIEIPKVDPISKEKITLCSALGKGLIAAIFCALRLVIELNTYFS